MEATVPLYIHFVMYLLFYDLQNFHRADLRANTAGDTLGSIAAFLLHHNLHGADLDALTAGGTQLLVDHINAGLGILGDCASLTDLSALAALDAGHGLCSAILIHNADAAQILMEFLIKGFGASANALQASHTFYIFLNGKLLHLIKIPFSIIFYYYTKFSPK